MKSILALLLACVALTGCEAAKIATTQFDASAAAKSAYAARAAYAGLLSGAVAYSSRPRCGQPTSPVLCSEASVVAQLRQASAAADAATSAAENAVRSMGANPTVIQAAVTAGEQSVAAFKAVTMIYQPAQ